MAGFATSIGFSQDIKDVLGGGWGISAFDAGDWKGYTFGVSVGAGESLNMGAVSFGKSNSILLNNVKKTEDRSFLDQAINLNPQTTFLQALYQYQTKDN